MAFEKNKQIFDKFLVPALIILISDQTIKSIALNKAFFDVDIYRNYGILFGFSLNFELIFVFFVIFFTILFWKRKKIFFSENNTILIPLGLICGGIISNFIDRIAYGCILDYINALGFFFNIADLAIFLGTSALGYIILKNN